MAAAFTIGSVLTRRRLLAGSAAAALSGISLGGCSNNPVFSDAAQTARTLIFGPPEVPIPRAAVAKLPYASIAAKVGDLPRGLLALGRIDGNDQYWVSSNRIALVTRRGRLIKTVGLGQNLRESRSEGTDPLALEPHRLTGPTRHARHMDLSEPDYYDLIVDAVLSPVGPEKITILEIEFDTILLTERNSARTLNWRFENRFWVDPVDGFVWRSIQYFGREYPSLLIEVAKPPTPVAKA